jgi:hypothetical protein
LLQCFAATYQIRPDFEKINEELDQIIVKSAIRDAHGRAFWIKNFLKRVCPFLHAGAHASGHLPLYSRTGFRLSPFSRVSNTLGPCALDRIRVGVL